VDDDPLVVRAIHRALGGLGHTMDSADTGEQALEMLSHATYAALIADHRLGGMNGVELCQIVRRRSPDTVCILLTAYADMDVVLAAINRASVFRFLTKPCERGDLRTAALQACEQFRMVREHRELSRLVERRALELIDINRELDIQVQSRTNELLVGLINALDLRDTETKGHSWRVAQYARRLAGELHMGAQDVLDVERGALLHDIGKIGVSDTILLKPAKLTEQEWVEMRKHTQYGYEILRGIEFLGSARLIVRSHHERFDGKGYPDRLTGDAIPAGARIFAVIDTYDAMTSDRPYRKALPASVALQEIQKHLGTQFDPTCAAAFLGIPQAELDTLRDRVAESHTAGPD